MQCRQQSTLTAISPRLSSDVISRCSTSTYLVLFASLSILLSFSQPIDRHAEIMPSIARLHLSARKAVKHSKNDYARRMYSHVLTAWRNGTPTECAVAQVSS
jgi:hypothetical protein